MKPPLISVVMPYWHRQPQLTRSLEMHESLYPGLNLEIVVVDDGNEIPPDVSASPRARIVGLPLKRGALNPCVPINRGVEASRGTYIVLTNPEIVHNGPILGGLMAYCAADVYAGCVVQQNGRWIAHPEHFCGHGPVPRSSVLNHCAMLRRALFDKAGGFDEAYRPYPGWDDNDFLFRLKAAGARFITDPSLVVEHERSTTRWSGHAHNEMRFFAKWGKDPDVANFMRRHARQAV